MKKKTTERKKKRVLIAQLVPPEISTAERKERMEELENLANTYQGIVVVKTVQKKSKPDYNYFIGKGKLEEIKLEMESQEIDLLIVGNILKPHQTYNISEKMQDIKVEVWDKIDLILKIFEKHADSTEAKLQIELASIKHMGPRIFGMGMELSRQGGGIGTRGKGETNIQLMKRHLKEREKKIKQKLQHYKKVRDQHRKSRKKKNLPTVGIVGYTNVGKSSLLNALTAKGALEQNKLFATLGTNVSKVYIPTGKGEGKEILLNDTIGFIRELPPSLIDAFSSTLEDSIESEVLLHIVDSSDSNLEEKIRIVDEILDSIKARQPRIYVFNKKDKINQERLLFLKSTYSHLEPVFISSAQKEGLEDLKKKLLEFV